MQSPLANQSGSDLWEIWILCRTSARQKFAKEFHLKFCCDGRLYDVSVCLVPATFHYSSSDLALFLYWHVRIAFRHMNLSLDHPKMTKHTPKMSTFWIINRTTSHLRHKNLARFLLSVAHFANHGHRTCGFVNVARSLVFRHWGIQRCEISWQMFFNLLKTCSRCPWWQTGLLFGHNSLKWITFSFFL